MDMEAIDGGYTPAQLRAMADEMEGKQQEQRPATVRHVEVEGIGLDIDMRTVGDIRTLRLVRDARKGGDDAVFAALDLFDALLGDKRAEVEKALEDEDGYIPADSYVDFCAKVFEAVGAKN